MKSFLLKIILVGIVAVDAHSGGWGGWGEHDEQRGHGGHGGSRGSGVRGDRGRDSYFERGRKDGKRKAERCWKRDYDESCYNIWEFQQECENEMLEGDYRQNRRDNWRMKSYKRGAREGVKRVLLEKQELCMTADECDGLGRDAAAFIAFQFCKRAIEADGTSAMIHRYPKACREVGRRTCEGNIYEEIKYYCDVDLDLWELDAEQEKCDEEVKQMTGYYD